MLMVMNGDKVNIVVVVIIVCFFVMMFVVLFLCDMASMSWKTCEILEKYGALDIYV